MTRYEPNWTAYVEMARIRRRFAQRRALRFGLSCLGLVAFLAGCAAFYLVAP